MKLSLTTGQSVVAPGAGLLEWVAADKPLVGTAPPPAQKLDRGGWDARMGSACRCSNRNLCVLIAARGWCTLCKRCCRCFRQIERKSRWLLVN